jgi:pSer/pThr/pTyr-binding forkhead associated (FHA) protein
MAKRYLIFTKEGVDKTVPLEEEVIFIGRKSINDIPLLDPTVSRQHAVIYSMGDEVVLEDLRSHNGTFVNGKRIKRHALSSGDIIRIGNVIFRFSQEGELTE